MPSGALLQAPKINKIPISAVASVKTSGVLVTIMFLFFAASKSMFPNPTAKFDNILTLLGSLFIVSESNLSVRADKIPSHPALSSINFSWEYNSSLELNFELNIFEALSSLDLSSFLVIRIFLIWNINLNQKSCLDS